MHGQRRLTTGRCDQALRLKRREEQDAVLKLMSLEAMVRDFEGVALDLAQQIAAEEARTGITDPAHFAYSTFATAARIRLSNLSTTIADLSAKLDSARRDYETMSTELQELAPREGRESLAQTLAGAAIGRH